MSRAVVLSAALGACVLVSVACSGILGIPEVERAVDAGPVTEGSAGCSPDEKSCGGRCVELTSSVTGCAGLSCEPCALDRATAICVSGACAVELCSPGWGDCNLLPEDGCEHQLGDADNCTGCGDRCRAGFTCGRDGCACEGAAACGSGGSCANGRCVCDGQECPPGWLCRDGECSPL